MPNDETTLGLAGLGAVGRTVAERAEQELPGYRVTAVSARRKNRARQFLSSIGADAAVVEAEELADHADVVVEALPASLFPTLAESVLEQRKHLVVLSAGALLDNWELVELAERRGGRIHVPSGAILGLDAVLAAAEGNIESVAMVTRKPVEGLLGAPFLESRGLRLEDATEPVKLFEGTAREAITGFPANLNVAVALSLAGTGPDRTHLEIWADPDIDRNTHHVEVESDSARLRLAIENIPSDENPRTGRITALSVVALLRKLRSHLRVGT